MRAEPINGPARDRPLWRIFAAMAYDLLGVGVALALVLFAAPRFYHRLDRFAYRGGGEARAVVLHTRFYPQADREKRYEISLRLSLRPRPQAPPRTHTFRLFHEGLYNQINKKQKEPYRIKLSVVWARRLLSGEPFLLQAGSFPLWKRLKSAQLILFLGLSLVGGAIALTSLRDLRRCVADLRYRRWLEARKKASPSDPSST